MVNVNCVVLLLNVKVHIGMKNGSTITTISSDFFLSIFTFFMLLRPSPISLNTESEYLEPTLSVRIQCLSKCGQGSAASPRWNT